MPHRMNKRVYAYAAESLSLADACLEISFKHFTKSDHSLNSVFFCLLIDFKESCNGTRQIFSRLGQNVTLQLPRPSGVAFIVWDINNIDHLAITRPGQIESQNYCYSERLSVMSDGSLRLSRITANDEQIFRAELYTNNWVHCCTQFFEVKLQSKFKTFLS